MFGALLGSIVGGIGQASSARSAARTSAAALRAQQEQQGKVWGAVDPYMKAGGGAVANLTDPNAFMTSPGYQFRLDQGLEATAGNRAVNGLLRSGGAMKALTNYAQGAASDEFGKYNAQQMGIAQLGLQGAGIGAGVANANSAAIGQDATNRANAGMAGANAWSGIAGQVGGAFDRMRTPAPSTKMSSYG